MNNVRQKLLQGYVTFFILFAILLIPFGIYLATVFEKHILEGHPIEVTQKVLIISFVLFGLVTFILFGLAFGYVLTKVTRPMKATLVRMVSLERDFVANASHELKTPITIIRGFAETLHEHPELKREVVQEITSKIVTSCERMETLVRNLLTLAALDEGINSFRLKEFDIEDLVEEVKAMILVVHPDAQIAIQIKNPPVIMEGDSDLVLQAILNLIDNAVKYSKPPAHVTVGVEKRMQEVVVSVKDRGIGIPAEHLDRIFERFYAVDKSYSRSLGGSGLGLSIVRGIVDRHGGHIEVKSKVNEGSTFTLRFPLKSK